MATPRVGGRSETLFETATPAQAWDQDSAKRALDELFTLTSQYKSSSAFHSLLQFVARFRSYSPFNAMLVHVQMPGARYVAPPHRWLRDYGREIAPGAQPLVILQPKGPVMFVFDVSDTEPTEGAPALPPQVTDPFKVRRGWVGARLPQLIYNAIRDGVRVVLSSAGSQSGGSIARIASGVHVAQEFIERFDEYRAPVFIHIPVRYDLVVNQDLSPEAQYVTIAHELAHLYCGHLGTPDDRWWPDRTGLGRKVVEFEAESVAYLISGRAGLDNPSEEYLAGYLKKNSEVPPLSLECVMKAAGLIEQMSQERQKPRPPRPPRGTTR